LGLAPESEAGGMIKLKRQVAFLWLGARRFWRVSNAQERETRMTVLALLGAAVSVFLLGVGVGGNGLWALVALLLGLFVVVRVRSFYVTEAARRLGLEQSDAYKVMEHAERHLDDALDKIARECRQMNLLPPWWVELVKPE